MFARQRVSTGNAPDVRRAMRGPWPGVGWGRVTPSKGSRPAGQGLPVFPVSGGGAEQGPQAGHGGVVCGALAAGPVPASRWRGGPPGAGGVGGAEEQGGGPEPGARAMPRGRRGGPGRGPGLVRPGGGTAADSGGPRASGGGKPVPPGRDACGPPPPRGQRGRRDARVFVASGAAPCLPVARSDWSASLWTSVLPAGSTPRPADGDVRRLPAGQLSALVGIVVRRSGHRAQCRESRARRRARENQSNHLGSRTGIPCSPLRYGSCPRTALWSGAQLG